MRNTSLANARGALGHDDPGRRFTALRLVAVTAPLSLALTTATAQAQPATEATEDDDTATAVIEKDRAKVAEDDDDDDDDDDYTDDRDDDDDDDDDDKRFRLNIESEMLGGSWFNSDTQGLDDSVSFGFGLARQSLLDGGNAVFLRPLFSLGFGWVFADNRAVLGTKVAFTVDGFELEDSDRVLAVGGRLIPYFHWIFRPERRIRPYFEVRAGLGGSATTAENLNDRGGTTTTAFIYPQVGGGLGLHMFPRDWFSVDLGLNVDYAAPYSRTVDTEGPDTDWEKFGDVVNYGLMLGVSTWF